MVAGDPAISERLYRFISKASPVDAACGALSGRPGKPFFIGAARVEVIAVNNNRIDRSGKLLRKS